MILYNSTIIEKNNYITITYNFDYENDDYDKNIRIPGIRIYKKSISSYQDIFNLYDYDIQKIILTYNNKYYTTNLGKFCIDNKLIITDNKDVPIIFYKYGYKKIMKNFNRDELLDELLDEFNIYSSDIVDSENVDSSDSENFENVDSSDSGEDLEDILHDNYLESSLPLSSPLRLNYGDDDDE